MNFALLFFDAMLLLCIPMSWHMCARISEGRERLPLLPSQWWVSHSVVILSHLVEELAQLEVYVIKDGIEAL